MGREIHALNTEMIAAGVRKFACGLGSAKSLRAQADGRVLITDGPYVEGAEIATGIYLLSAADRDEAVKIASMIPASAVHLRQLAGVSGL